MKSHTKIGLINLIVWAMVMYFFLPGYDWGAFEICLLSLGVVALYISTYILYHMYENITESYVDF